MASVKFTKEQMTVYAKQIINSCNSLVEALNEEGEFDTVGLDCQVKSIERDVESLRFRLDDCDE